MNKLAQYWTLGDTTSDRSPTRSCTTDYKPLGSSLQPGPNSAHCPLIQSSSWPYEEVVGDSIKSLAEVRVHSPLFSLQPARELFHHREKVGWWNSESMLTIADHLPVIHEKRWPPEWDTPLPFQGQRSCWLDSSSWVLLVLFEDQGDVCFPAVLSHLSWSPWPFKDDREWHHFSVCQLPQQSWTSSESVGTLLQAPLESTLSSQDAVLNTDGISQLYSTVYLQLILSSAVLTLTSVFLTLLFSLVWPRWKLAVSSSNLQFCLHTNFPDTFPWYLESFYVTMTGILNKYYSKEFIQLGKQVKITSLYFQS